jgi:hypothetical protein
MRWNDDRSRWVPDDEVSRVPRRVGLDDVHDNAYATSEAEQRMYRRHNVLTLSRPPHPTPPAEVARLLGISIEIVNEILADAEG